MRPTDENSKLLGEIIAIYGAEAWVKWERDAGPATELLRRLERAP